MRARRAPHLPQKMVHDTKMPPALVHNGLDAEVAGRGSKKLCDILTQMRPNMAGRTGRIYRHSTRLSSLYKKSLIEQGIWHSSISTGWSREICSSRRAERLRYRATHDEKYCNTTHHVAYSTQPSHARTMILLLRYRLQPCDAYFEPSSRKPGRRPEDVVERKGNVDQCAW
ncbi:hypothetical protein EJ04DRAFT_4545 [Polyplosphaeria fusca]|uniref:Uncharacterized protein n=1 Tax=Polyplosphaeria fusca TaxID=682080 RepID=A0A9P4RDC2_9PLEO|nr:hypothetical protein EJ04DRAFT_4545 [Polyplosphaeria fusca]